MKLIDSFFDLDLSARAFNILYKLECRTIADVVVLDEHKLARTKNCGKRTVTEIKNVLAAKGFTLGDLSVERELISEPLTPTVLAEVAAERIRQDWRWGPPHPRGLYPYEWGEMIAESLQRATAAERAEDSGLSAYEDSMIHIAALAVAAVETTRRWRKYSIRIRQRMEGDTSENQRKRSESDPQL